MASIQFGGGVSNAVGSHAGNTFARNKGGSYMKKRAYGVNPRSGSQSSYRAQLGQLSNHYSFKLTDANRAAWRAFAASVPTVNRLGNTTFLSGQQMFTKCNAVLVNRGLAPVATPPVSTAIATITSITVVATHDPGGSLLITPNTTSTSVDEKVWIWVSPPLNPGRAFVSSLLRRVATTWQPDAVATITIPYRALFGSLPSAAGQRIFVRCQLVNWTNGITSPFLNTSSLWV